MKNAKVKLPRQPFIALVLILLIGAWMFGQMSYILIHQLRDVPMEFNLLLVIRSIIQDTFANHILWELLLNLTVGFSCLVLCKQLIKQMKLYKQWKTYIESNKNDELSDRLRAKLPHESFRMDVVSEPKLLAMTIGFWKPRIILSTGMIERFNEDELTSILYHELFHYKHRHPLHYFILSIIAECLAFLPIVKRWVHCYKVWMELLADRYTIYRMGSELHLAQVLLKIIKNDQLQTQEYGVHLANESVNFRLKQLIDPQSDLNVPLFEWKAIWPSIFVLTTMLIIILLGCI